MRPIICVDDTFLKSKYRETLIIATCQDVNGQIYPIAWGIVDSENDSSWSWFMSNLKEQVGDSNQLVFISDRHKSIAKSIKMLFPQYHHGFCMWHMEQNIKVKFHTKGLIPLFKSAAEAYRMSEFESCMAEICRKNMQLGKYLEDADYDSWSRAHFKVNLIATYKFQVGLDAINMDVVNITLMTCSCKKFDMLEISYGHAIAAAKLRGISIYSLCSKYYKTTCWRASYAEPIHPVYNEIHWLIPSEVQERVILPSFVRRPRGRRWTRSIRSMGEISLKFCCSTCGSTGHYEKSCKNPTPI
ncbi:uncharacterized protein [Henckelia pumila]|uniref:uncharacterized protein n=1 Tax=Henckelia pumila TaxID=405737 RepID=UPI003C6DE408